MALCSFCNITLCSFTGALSNVCGAISNPFACVGAHSDAMQALTVALSELQARRDSVLRHIAATESAGRERSPADSWWLSRAESITTEVNGIVQADEANKISCHGRHCSPNCCLSCIIVVRAERKLEELRALIAKGEKLEECRSSVPAPVFERNIPSTVLGLDAVSQEICGYFRDDGVGVVGICGMGGVGKTTLLRKINNQLLGGSCSFDHVVTASVSMRFDLEKLQDDIAEGLGLLPLPAAAHSRAGVISRFLSKKKFLLLLDDLWGPLDLEAVGIPYPHSIASGSVADQRKRVLVFVTRHEEVCSKMKCHKKIQLNCLSEDDAWSLFRDCVGEEVLDADQGIPGLAREVASKCNGLPLALVTIGQAMSTKKTLGEWRNTLAKLQSSRPGSVSPMMESMFPVLKLSYNCLPEERVKGVKDCFLCCALWPEGHLIEKAKLVKCWMGLGLIEEFNEIDEAYYTGDELIGAMRAASLLDHSYSRDSVMMHNVMREMALWIARECGKNREKWIVHPTSLSSVSKTEVEKWGRAERVSLMCSQISMLPLPPSPCPNLSALILQGNAYLCEIPPSFFTCLPALTYLDLSDTSIEELPEDIGGLSELRYIDLSRTELKSLPRELGSLAKLRYLYLEATASLSTVPRGVLSGLLNLQVLNLYGSKFADWEAVDDGQDKESTCRISTGLGELQLMQELKSLGITITTDSALHWLSTMVSSPMRAVRITGLQALVSLKLLSSFLSMRGLRRLTIADCDDLQTIRMNGKFAKEGNCKACLPRLEILQLQDLGRLTEIVWESVVPRSCVPELRSLTINGCHMLKNISWVLQLPRLEEIHLSYCSEFATLISNDRRETRPETASFPALKRMTLMRLPRLANITGNVVSFPSLEFLKVDGCPKLKRLPLEPARADKLRRIQASQEWWEGLQWENASDGSYFSNYRTVIP